MPIFEYRCGSCGDEFELLILPRSSSTPACPSCQSDDLQKLFSAVTINSDHSQRRSRRDALARKSKLQKEANHEEHRRIHEHHAEHHES